MLNTLSSARGESEMGRYTEQVYGCESWRDEDGFVNDFRNPRVFKAEWYIPSTVRCEIVIQGPRKNWRHWICGQHTIFRSTKKAAAVHNFTSNMFDFAKAFDLILIFDSNICKAILLNACWRKLCRVHNREVDLRRDIRKLGEFHVIWTPKMHYGSLSALWTG